MGSPESIVVRAPSGSEVQIPQGIITDFEIFRAAQEQWIPVTPPVTGDPRAGDQQ